jgi:hypothetical protein
LRFVSDQLNNTIYEPAAGDSPIASKTLQIKFPNGTIYKTVVTGSDGKFNFTATVAFPSGVLTVVDSTNPSVTLGTIQLDATGSGDVQIPIPPVPPKITGRIWYDNDKSLNFTSGDVPLASVEIALVFANGTTYLTTTTDANGNFSFNPTILQVGSERLLMCRRVNLTIFPCQASPTTVFSVIRTSDNRTLGSLTTDALGNG